MFLTLFYLASLIGVLPLIIFRINKKKSGKNYIEPFLWLTFFASVYEVIGTGVFSIPSAVWFTIYQLLEFISFWYFFFNLADRKNKLFFKTGLVVYLALFIALLPIKYFYTDFNADAYLSIVEIAFVGISTALWFNTLLKRNPDNRAYYVADFCFSGGITLYLSGTFFLNLMSDVLLNTSKSNFEFCWQLNILFSIALRLLLILGICKIRRVK